MIRILHGLDRVPATLAIDDPRLPAIDLGPTRLRLNTLPIWDAAEGNHAARMAAMRAWLLDGCGDYNEPLRRGVTRYLDAISDHIEQHRDTLAAILARFHGLYQVEDWCWSAPRPLPRAWWQRDGAWQRADLAFWDGNEVIAMRTRDFDTGDLPPSFQQFWTGEILPVSPFRRPFPTDLNPSSPAHTVRR